VTETNPDTDDKDLALALSAARVFVSHLNESQSVKSVAESLLSFANHSLSPHRALVHASRIAASLEKTDRQLHLSPANLEMLMRVSGSSDFFAEMIAANPALINSLDVSAASALRRDYRAILRAAIDAENTFPAELAALRHKWAELIAEIGALDISGEFSI